MIIYLSFKGLYSWIYDSKSDWWEKEYEKENLTHFFILIL